MRIGLGNLLPLAAQSSEWRESWDQRVRSWGCHGLAICPALGLLVISHNATNSLVVFTLPSILALVPGAGASAGLALVCTLGGPSMVPHPVPP